MITYIPALAKDFASDANVWRNNHHVFYFVVASVLQQGKIVCIILESLFIHCEEAYLESNQRSMMEPFCEDS